MTLLARMQAAVAHDPALLEAWRAASPGDRSLLQPLLDTEGAQVMTIAGSANARLWSLFEAIGVMRRVEHPTLTQIAPELGMQNFELTDEGYRAVPVLLAIFSEAAESDADTAD